MGASLEPSSVLQGHSACTENVPTPAVWHIPASEQLAAHMGKCQSTDHGSTSSVCCSVPPFPAHTSAPGPLTNPRRGSGSSARFRVGWLQPCLCSPLHRGPSAATQRAKCHSGRCRARSRKTQPAFFSFPAFTTRCHWKSSTASAVQLSGMRFWGRGGSRSFIHCWTRSIFPASSSSSMALSVCRASGKTIAGDSGFNGH